MNQIKKSLVLPLALSVTGITSVGCGGEDTEQGAGRLSVSIAALTPANLLSRVAIEIQPAGILTDLTFDQASGTFSGQLAVPAGEQTISAQAFAGPHVLAGEGTVVANVQSGIETNVFLRILDVTGRLPLPDNGPVILSLVANPQTTVVGELGELSIHAVDPDGDVVGYRWDYNCVNVGMSSRTTQTTTWSASQPGACIITGVAESNGLEDQVSIIVETVEAPVGTPENVSIATEYVPQPSILGLSIMEDTTFRIGYCAFDRDESGNAGCSSPSLTAGSTKLLRVFHNDPIGTLTVTDDCGGQVQLLANPNTTETQFEWTIAASTSGFCSLRVAAENHGLQDEWSLPVRILTAE